MSESQSILEMSKESIRAVEAVMNRALGNEYITTSIKILLALYAALAAPKLPKVALDILSSTFSKIVGAFLIVFMSTQNPGIALLIAVAFVITLQTANKMKMYDTSLSVADDRLGLSWLPSSKEVETEEEEKEDDADDVPTEMGSNLVEHMKADEGLPHVTPKQLLKMQDNQVPGVDQNSCAEQKKDSHCIQGLESDKPSGFPGSIMYQSV